jgi:PhoU domain
MIDTAALEGDPHKAARLRHDDDAMDDLHRHLFTVLMDCEWTHGAPTAVDITLLSRDYERFVDHAVEIARRVIYQATSTDSVDRTSSSTMRSSPPASCTPRIVVSLSCGSPGKVPMPTRIPRSAKHTAVAAPTPDAAPVLMATGVRAFSGTSVISGAGVAS